MVLRKKDGLLDKGVRLEVGEKPEVYTEENATQLGNTERSCTLFVNGYKRGKRIYDQVNGKTCHQCRQKTLGYHTHCCNCQMLRGQFCGDCLYMRYGEHVLEAIENPNWICPVCRGICNCSFCRQAKGWPPTGNLYRKISSLGYKSVAHYLIQTQQSKNKAEKQLVSANHVSVKRSLPFSDMEALFKESPQANNKQVGLLKLHGEKEMDESMRDQEQQMTDNRNLTTDCQTKMSLPSSDDEAQQENMETAEVNCNVNDDHSSPNSKSEGKEDNVFKGEEEGKLHSKDKMHDDGNTAPESYPKLRRNLASDFKSSSDRIAVRLRQRRRKGDGHDDTGLKAWNDEISTLANPVLEKAEGQRAEDMDTVVLDSCLKLSDKARPTEPSADSIGARLRKRRKIGNGHDDAKSAESNEKNLDSNKLSDQEEEKGKEAQARDDKQADVAVSLKSSPKLKKKAHDAESSPDSIGGRLRQRRQMGKCHDHEGTTRGE